MIREYATAAIPGGGVIAAGVEPAQPRSTFYWLVLILCLVMVTSCATLHTSVDKVWQDGSRPKSAPLGKTLVLVLWSDPAVVSVLDDEWVRQLNDRGIEAQAVNVLRPGEHASDKQDVVRLVRSGGFKTLLVSRVVGVKVVEREAPGSEVAVVETVLYDASTERRFWSAEAHTFLHHPVTEPISELRASRAKNFVETLIAEMSGSGLF